MKNVNLFIVYFLFTQQSSAFFILSLACSLARLCEHTLRRVRERERIGDFVSRIEWDGVRGLMRGV
jgi:hypothetical protein